MAFKRYYMLFLLLVLLVGVNSNVLASGSGAFRVETPDAGAFGKGSAFVGEANTPAAVYYNPAGLNQIERAQVSVGTSYLAPAVDYQPTSGDKVQMHQNRYWIPHFYAALPVNPKLAVGFGATSYFGLGTEWAKDGPLRYDTTKASILNQDYMLTASYKVTDQLSFAAGPDYDYTKANKSKKLAQANGSDGNFTLKADDGAIGYRLATMFKLNEQHQFGLMYRSRIQHKYEGKAYIDGLNTSATLAGMGLSSDSYQGVFSGNAYETKATQKFTLPQSVVLGYSFKPTNKWTFNVDIEWMDWSSVKYDILDFPDETDASRLAVLTGGNPIGHSWKAVWSESIGAEYAATDRLRLRGGYYHHMSPIPESTWDPNLPDANSHGITSGFGYDLTKNITLDMAYSILLYEAREVNNTVNDTYGGVDGKYRQVINIGLITLTYKY